MMGEKSRKKILKEGSICRKTESPHTETENGKERKKNAGVAKVTMRVRRKL